ncbi:MAG: hypothetical protein ACKV2T_00890 [Kofleriaceae bacterium]
MSRRLVTAAVVLSLGSLAYAQPAGKPLPKQQPPVKEAITVTCDFIEITATSEKEASVDPALAALKKKFRKPPFSSWNVFKMQHRESRTLAQKKPETIRLKVGQAEAKFLGTANKSQLRLSISLDVNGKNIVNTTATVEAADYLVYGHALPDNAGHLLALTCK